MTTTDQNAKTVCETIYTEAKCFYQPRSHRCDQQGFQILYGPPILGTPILFIGYQPGKGSKTPEDERCYGSEDGWPRESEYVTEKWPLARALRNMFEVETLKTCVGLNAIFIRSPSIDQYHKLERGLRHEIAEFCLPRVERMIEAIQPQKVIAIGFRSLELFGRCEPDLKSPSGRVLTKSGMIAKRPAIGMLHLTGARISNEDRLAIRDHIMDAH